ncbi:extracellular solute-binding protein, family 3 [Desulfonatronum thiosulfatophilum]|uniref:Extracellular solute-binding protein, family 3 n=1 Tax=Desulfonatronum thiosulfatophilum TaxID=617002 RepID=A0A1G6CCW6_9BACT|nr:transporter substrate-binding domain-containing protein [Desulfonatronum thiosulfatophilum]SDB30730.1 extracellular solute-binding protein, family 3 [Desulfonatronum thiosulfatophilum]
MNINLKYPEHVFRAVHVIALFCVILGSVFLFPWQSQARSFQEIISSCELRVCFAPIHPSVVNAEPMDCREDCRFSGPAFDAVQAFAAFLGQDMHIKGVRVDWEEQFFDENGRIVRDAEYTPSLLASGRCDIYPNNLTREEWRLTKMDIPTLFTNRFIVLINIDKAKEFLCPSDMGGRIAAVEKDTAFHSWLQQENDATYAANPVDIRLMPTDEVLRGLDAGLFDFTVIDADAAFWIIRQQYPALHMVFPVGPMTEVGWGLRQEDTELLEAVRLFFSQQRNDHASPLNEIWKRHYGMSLNQFIGLLSSIPE